MLTKKIGFIGPGKVGCSFGRHIAERGGDDFIVCGYFGRNRAAAKEASALAGGRPFDSAEELAEACDLLLITVPDKQIADVWTALSEKLPDRSKPLYVGHCSGSQDSTIFRPKSGCIFGSIHPLLAVYDKEHSYKNFDGAYFTIEGDSAFKTLAGELLTALENPFCSIEADQKAQYHAAAVMVSNLVCAIAYQGIEIYKACGLDEEFADNAWRSLFLGNAKNIALHGPVHALTGPGERCDVETVVRHISALTGSARENYLLLSRVLVETAKQKNPERDYSELIELLEHS